MSICLVDCGLGNLGSVSRSFAECGEEIRLCTRPDQLDLASKVVLPGVGSFAEGMERLQEGGWIDPLKDVAVRRGLPLLGICLGMHLLAELGSEGGVVQGLGLIPGEVNLLEPGGGNERLPHVGWNEVHIRRDHQLFSPELNGADFYFVHSYHFVPTEASAAVAHTPYCGEFVSAVARENVMGVQFHPEKSSFAGLRLIKNFIQI